MSSIAGRSFSPVGEFLIPARTREKEGEKGKRRREKKEERDICDYQTTNTNKSSNCIFKMLKTLGDAFPLLVVAFLSSHLSVSLPLSFLVSFHQ